jgi:hypothetical protein
MENLTFSRPIFRADLLPAYYQALRAIGLTEWHLLREKLYTKYADQIVAALVSYANAFVERKTIEKVWLRIADKPRDLSSEIIHAELMRTKRTERATYANMSSLLGYIHKN